MHGMTKIWVYYRLSHMKNSTNIKWSLLWVISKSCILFFFFFLGNTIPRVYEGTVQVRFYCQLFGVICNLLTGLRTYKFQLKSLFPSSIFTLFQAAPFGYHWVSRAHEGQFNLDQDIPPLTLVWKLCFLEQFEKHEETPKNESSGVLCLSCLPH